jgi:hypothetical protein
MESIHIKVPKNLIQSFEEHPEPYGDYVVILKNDMYTDVYKGDDGEWYTITNDEALIAYLNHQDHLEYCIQCGEPLIEGALFCKSCGHKVEAPVQKVKIKALSKNKQIWVKWLAIYSVVFAALAFIGMLGVDEELYGDTSKIYIVVFTTCYLLSGVSILILMHFKKSISTPLVVLTVIYGLFEYVSIVMLFSSIRNFLISQTVIAFPIYCIVRYYKK